MKIIYQKIVSILSGVSDLKFIDLDKGQLDYYSSGRPNVAFPAALINIELPECIDESDTIQRVRAQAIIRIAFDFTGETSAATPSDVRDTSLNYFETVEAVYKALQGYSDSEVESISRAAVRQEVREDGYKVSQIIFNIWFDDVTADED